MEARAGFQYCAGIMLTEILRVRLVLGNNPAFDRWPQTNSPNMEDAEPGPDELSYWGFLWGPLFVLAPDCRFCSNDSYVISSHLPTVLKATWFLRTSSMLNQRFF